MPKRTICINSPASLSTQSSSLSIETPSGLASIPFEDIWVLIIESNQARITTRALSDLCAWGIGTIFCDRSHHPNGLLLPLGAHSRHAAIVEDQLLISKPLKKQLWQAIVKRKIENQAKVLEILKKPGSDKLWEHSKKVLSGDTSGREAVAASFYFRSLIESGGRRNSELTPALDYGYSILRAGIARSAVSGGWLVSRGIHHCNNENAFNLVDDLIEPFRPVVDLLAVKTNTSGTFNAKARHSLVEIFEYNVLVDSKTYTVQSAIDNLLTSFKRAVLEKNATLLELPTVIPLIKEKGEEK